MKGDVSMMKVVSVFDENKVLGTVNGLTVKLNNGATRTFMAKFHMINWLKSYSATIVE
jgi:hypothetical protein